MLNPSNFRRIVSGERRDFVSFLLRGLLRLIEIPYSWAVRYRNRAYDQGKKQIHQVAVPVICVGNLTLGGTGKTPMVQWLATWLGDRSKQPVIVSRGYGSKAGQLNDEAMELQLRLPSIAHVQNPDRVAASQQAISEHSASCILLDDGFQHRRLARDLDLVLLDASEPFGFDHLFPRGTLREPITGIRRAKAAILSRADLLTEDDRAKVEQRVKSYHPDIKWLEVTARPQYLINTEGQRQEISQLSGKQVGAFCAIGNPLGFWHTLKSCGISTLETREFDDHHQFHQSDFQSLDAWAEQHQLDALVCTVKDLVKFESKSLSKVPLWALSIELEFLRGEQLLEDLLLELFEKEKS